MYKATSPVPVFSVPSVKLRVVEVPLNTGEPTNAGLTCAPPTIVVLSPLDRDWETPVRGKPYTLNIV